MTDNRYTNNPEHDECMLDLAHPELDDSEVDPDGVPAHAPGAKVDKGKVRVGLMFKGFPRALLAVAEVVTFGAEKYSPLGFLEVKDAVDRYDDAKGRHILHGHINDTDTDSNLTHMAHEAWNALAKLECRLRAEESAK